MNCLLIALAIIIAATMYVGNEQYLKGHDAWWFVSKTEYEKDYFKLKHLQIKSEIKRLTKELEGQ